MTARRMTPGDRAVGRAGLQDGARNYNRTFVGQIDSVNTQTGVIGVSGPWGDKQKAVMPIHAMSVNGFGSSWIRYMPRVGDFVKYTYGPDKRVVLLGYAVWGDEGDNQTEGGSGGATEFYEGGYSRLSRFGRNTRAGLDDFVELKEGEWDLRSAGNAYIKGGANGTLLMSGGPVRLALCKTRNEAQLEAAMLQVAEGGVRLRLGDIKRRLLPTDFSDSTVDGAGKAWELDVSHQVAPEPAPATDYYEERIGDVRDSAGLPVLSPTTATRLRQRVFDGVPLISSEVYSYTVDATGNVDMTTSLGNWTTSTLTTAHSVSTTWDTNAGVTATLRAGTTVSLGRTGAIESVVKGTSYAAAENLYLGVTGPAHTTYGAFFTAVTGLAAALATAEGPASPVGIAAAGVTAIGAATAATAVAVTAAATAFSGTNVSGANLSLKVFTE